MELRAPSTVMKLERLGSFHPTRISFTRTLIRRMHLEKWNISLQHSLLDNSGFGHRVYRIETPSGILSFIAFSNHLDAADRTDRVIAEKWDTCFTLHNGEATMDDVERLRVELPKQEAGRMSAKEIVMSRANKSVRLFQSVVDSLASGTQPDVANLVKIGYLFRTTAVYGNGKFGCMDYDWVKKLTPFGLPFQAEMLTVYMARHFGFDLIQHVAKVQSNGKAVEFDRNLRRALGVGNATGLGMAPFLVSHPQLIHQWIMLREVAIQRVRSIDRADEKNLYGYMRLLKRIEAHIDQWTTEDEVQRQRNSVLKMEIDQLRKKGIDWLQCEFPWETFANWIADNTSLECIELANSIMLELHPELVNELEQHMSIEELQLYSPHMSLQELKSLIEQNYGWAIKENYNNKDSQHYFWYVSEEKEEPRRGKRYTEPGKELELRIGIAKEAASLYCCLSQYPKTSQDQTVASFLHGHPEHRFIVARIQTLKDSPYGEIRDNLLAKDCRPIDLLRCKLALFGATRFDPKSDLWTRITLFQGAPLADELTSSEADDWAFPSLSATNLE